MPSLEHKHLSCANQWVGVYYGTLFCLAGQFSASGFRLMEPLNEHGNICCGITKKAGNDEVRYSARNVTYSCV